ncbi:hypothetical protein F5Y17DRAFT_466487 [Xylariaceae sp. FL0594]|nr:hypothetical protein F5Y17DRAFT_466487 [Xylariaceae sp. FL0594]
MSLKPLLLLLLLCFVLLATASTHDIGLGDDITSFVPACARYCLLSFINANYPLANCGSSFSLQCLCPAPSLSGFTLTEAALQCVLGNSRLGHCAGADIADSTLSGVNSMCSGVRGALPNTHSKLTATIIIPQTGAPSILAPTPLVSQTLSPSTSPSSWTTVKASTSTSAVRSTSSFSTTVTATVTASATTITTTSSPASSGTSSPTLAPPATSSMARLTPGQVAGISVGVAGALALAVGGIFLAKCLRRRQYPDTDSEKGFYQTDNSTAEPDPSGLISRASRIFHISPPILRRSKYRPDFIPRVAPSVPGAVKPAPAANTPKLDRGMIGQAISRPRSVVPAKPVPITYSPMKSSPLPVPDPIEQKPSKLLPPRPALTIDIPANGTLSSQAPPLTDRTSTLTNMTAFADLDSAAAEGEHIWRPPPSDPLSATTLYVADKYGNWVLSNNNRRSQVAEIRSVSELDTYTPLTKSPIEKQEEAVKMAGAISAASPLTRAPPPPVLLKQDAARPTHNRSASSYSQASGPRQMGRRTSTSKNGLPKHTRKVSSGAGSGRPDSKASATTIQSSSSRGNDVARLSQLAPVRESPDAVTGRSQVSYPRIPGRLDKATIRHIPPPKRPNFSGPSFTQTSPTLGFIYPVLDSPGAYPLPLNTQRRPRPFAPTQRAGSGFTPEPPIAEVFSPQVSSPSSGISVSGRRRQPKPTPAPGAGPYQTSSSPPPQPPQNAARTPPAQTAPTFTPSPLSAVAEPSPPEPSPPMPAEAREGFRMHIASQFNNNKTLSFESSGTGSSSTSLVAKRLGNDKAAALVLDPSKERERAQQWRRQQEDGNGTLPTTPKWLPRLTPTRRGDDLYLNVQ